MTPRIAFLETMRLIGINRTMSFAQNQTVALWKSFMPRKGEITNPISSDLISLQIYPTNFNPADPTQPFVKWAGVPVCGFENVPDDMEALEVPSGEYAVFRHIGGPSTAARTFAYIFGEWLPSSGFTLDDRPHFEILGALYRHGDPASEEEIWIPVKKV